MIAKFRVLDDKDRPMFDLEFAVSREHNMIEEAWANGDPLTQDEIGRWVRRFTERAILIRATRPERTTEETVSTRKGAG